MATPSKERKTHWASGVSNILEHIRDTIYLAAMGRCIRSYIGNIYIYINPPAPACQGHPAVEIESCLLSLVTSFFLQWSASLLSGSLLYLVVLSGSLL